jgi:hypothetical protein
VITERYKFKTGLVEVNEFHKQFFVSATSLLSSSIFINSEKHMGPGDIQISLEIKKHLSSYF